MYPNRIILVRHGESEGNLNSEIYSSKPDYKLDLTEKGMIQSYNIGKQLRIIIMNETVCFHISPLFRTQQTYDQVIKSFTGLPYIKKEEPRIRDLEWGKYLTKDEISFYNLEHKNYGRFYYRFPNGESTASVYDRVSQYIDHLIMDFKLSKFHFENLVLITHNVTIKMIIMKMLYLSVADFEKMDSIENGSLTVLEYDKLIDEFKLA